jgi:hypothetical protein
MLDRYYSWIIIFSSLQFVPDLHNRKINYCGTVHHNRQGMPTNWGDKDIENVER